ncbi:MAG: hypothetical protein Q4A15_09575 [Prevotellaceae bacterium]|nr:hypothetical protein [Prevotellaceae bacterium]
MNVIKCRYEYDNGEVKEWPVRWAITKRMAGATYIHIEGRGTEFDAIIGRYSSGNFICIPSIDVGCGLAPYNDTFWNMEKLSKYLGVTDAFTITKALEHFDRRRSRSAIKPARRELMNLKSLSVKSMRIMHLERCLRADMKLL